MKNGAVALQRKVLRHRALDHLPLESFIFFKASTIIGIPENIFYPTRKVAIQPQINATDSTILSLLVILLP
jgi:hypothetical protein